MTKPAAADSMRAAGAGVEENRDAHAVASWIVNLTKSFLRSNGATHTPMIERIWVFSADKTDVDMRIGVQGRYKKLKVTTEMTGPAALRLRIQSWNAAGRPESPWERYGTFRGNGMTREIETLPLR